jgi:hypothetical protein
VADLMPGEWMGWLHGCFLVPHFVLFFMVLVVLIATFLHITFLPSSKQLSRLCLICLPFCAYSQAIVTQTGALKVAIHETSGCGLGAGGYVTHSQVPGWTHLSVHQSVVAESWDSEGAPDF